MATNGMYKPNDPKPSEKMAKEAMENLEKLTPWDSSKPKISKPVSQPTPNTVPYRTAGVSPADREAKEAMSRLNGLAPWDKGAKQTVAEKPAVQEGVAQSQSKKRSEQASPKPSDSMKKDTAQPSAVRTSDQTVRGNEVQLDQQKRDVATGQRYGDSQGQESPRRPTTISDIAVEQIGDQYVLHYKCDDPRVINRDNIVVPISKQEFDSFLAADDEGRFQLYNKICKVKEGASTYGGSTVSILRESTPEEQAAVLKEIRSVNWNQDRLVNLKSSGQNQPEQSFRIEVISAVDLAKRYMGDTPEAQEAAKEDIMSQLPPEQREVAQHMQDKMANWLKDNPMLLYGEKDGKPFIYDMTDREYDKYMVLNDEQKEKYLQKLFQNKETEAQKTVISNGQDRGPAPLSVLVPSLESDYEGEEYIKGQVAQAKAGGGLEIDKVNVHEASSLLVKLNDAGTKEQIPQETLDRLNGRYLMTAIVNGHTVSHVIDKETYDRVASMSDQQRKDEFCKVFDVPNDLAKAGEQKKTDVAATNGQKFGLLELLKALLQAFGFIPPEQERKADVKNDVTESQQKQQEPKESTTVDRSIAAQAKALSEANTEALVAEQQQSQEVSRGMHI